MSFLAAQFAQSFTIDEVCELRHDLACVFRRKIDSFYQSPRLRQRLSYRDGRCCRGPTGPKMTRQLCARNTGIGADGIEFFRLDRAQVWPHSPAQYRRLHRRDQRQRHTLRGGMDGARTRLQPGDELQIETDAGMRVCQINAVEHEQWIHRGSDHRHGRSHLRAAHGRAGRAAFRLQASRSPPAIRTSSSW